MYLMIENAGVCPVEGFTVLGLSTSRGTDLIGQFGSGAKHGVLCCLRSGVECQIWLGEEQLSFWTADAEMKSDVTGSKRYKRVGYNWKGEKVPLSLSLDFGAIDWTEVGNGLREFVSNALDAVGLDVSKIEVSIVDVARPKRGTTRVFLKMHPEVMKFYSELNTRFLHFTGDEKKSLLVNNDSLSKGKVYCKGVFVRDTPKVSVFSYNLQSKKLNESRTMSQSYMSYDIAKIVADSDPRMVLQYLKSFVRTYEGDLSPVLSRKWGQVFRDLYPGAYIWTGNDLIALSVVDKGKAVIQVTETWHSALKAVGVETCLDCLYPNKVGNMSLVPASKTLQSNVARVWGKLNALGLCDGKSPPGLSAFRNIMKGGSEIQGCCRGSTVYILEGQENNISLILEELGHYITNAGDFTRDLQTWALTVAARSMDICLTNPKQ